MFFERSLLANPRSALALRLPAPTNFGPHSLMQEISKGCIGIADDHESGGSTYLASKQIDRQKIEANYNAAVGNGLCDGAFSAGTVNHGCLHL